MRIFYLILAHKEPAQLERLINQLSDNNVCFIVHIDAKSNIEEFKSVLSHMPITYVSRREDCIWGDFSIVQATLNMISELKALGAKDKDRIVLISGQDYPIRSKNEIIYFFSKNEDIDFISGVDAEKYQKNNLRNFLGYKLNLSSKRSDVIILRKYGLKGVVKALLKNRYKLKYIRFFFTERKTKLTMYKGSQWWALKYSTLENIVNYYHEHLDSMTYLFEKSFCPDEYFFQTILWKLKEDNKRLVVKPSVTYVNWTRPNVVLPVTFGIEDFKELEFEAKEKLYARKFDACVDSEILNKIDNIIKN